MLQQYDYLFLFITGNLLSGSDAALIKRLFADDKPFLVVRADCSVDLQSVYDAERKRNAVFNDFDWNLVKQRLHLSCK